MSWLAAPGVRLCWVFAACFSAAGCHDPAFGISLDLAALRHHAALEVITISRIELRVTAHDIEAPIVVDIDIDADPGASSFDVAVPAGANRKVEVEAFHRPEAGEETPAYWGQARVDIPADEVVDLVMPIYAAARLRGTVRRVDGEDLIAGLALSFTPEAPLSGLPALFTAPVETGAYGRTLPAGRYDVRVGYNADGLYLPLPVNVEVARGLPAELDLLLVAPGYCDPEAGHTPDSDGDGRPDVCDRCPLDDPDDTDRDGACDANDPCPLDNPDDANADGVCDSEEAPPALSVADASASEGDINLTFTLSLSEPDAAEVTVGYHTSDGTASAGSDFSATAGSSTFAPGETVKTIAVSLLDDTSNELEETFSLLLVDPVNAVIEAGSATGRIIDDDDPPAVELAADSISIDALEADGAVNLAVNLDAPSTLDVTVSFAANGSSTAQLNVDYTISPSPLLLPAGQVTALIEVMLIDDQVIDESDVTLVLDLTAADHAVLGDRVQAQLRIFNDDFPPLQVIGAMTMDADLDGRLDHYRVELNHAVVDDTFPGFIADALGDPQSDWSVDGRANVVLAHGAAAPEPDVVDNHVIYLRFTQGIGLDTGEKPDLATTATPGLEDENGVVVTQVEPGSGLTEVDGARPVLVCATTENWMSDLILIFSEPVTNGGACPGGQVGAADFQYTSVDPAGVVMLMGGADADGCDGRVALAGQPEPFLWDDIGADRITPGATLQDVAQNQAAPVEVVVRAVEYPYLLKAWAVDAGTVRVMFSEPVVEASAEEVTGYAFEPYVGPGCAGQLTPQAAVMVSDTVVELTVSGLDAECLYLVWAGDLIVDLDEGLANPMPGGDAFLIAGPFELMLARSLDPYSVLLTFSRDLVPTGPGGADDPTSYSLAPELGEVLSATPWGAVTGDSADNNQVLLRHREPQTGRLYNVSVSALLRSAGGADLAMGPFDRTVFFGTGFRPESVADGPLATAAALDHSTRPRVALGYDGIYLGPSANSDALYRIEPDAQKAMRVTFLINSASGGFSSFGAHLTVPIEEVTSGEATTTVYHLPVGTDLSLFSGGDFVEVTGCADADNDASVTDQTVIDGAANTIALDDGTLGPRADEICVLTVFRNDGPAGFDGLDSLTTAFIWETPFLVLGAHNRGGGPYPELYLSYPFGTLMPVDSCDISAVTGDGTQSLQTVFAEDFYFYLGFSAAGGAGPLFAFFEPPYGPGSGCLGLSDQVTGMPPFLMSGIQNIGAASQISQNQAENVGIDSMAIYYGNGGALYVANNGGIAATNDVPPTSQSNWNPIIGESDWQSQGSTRELPRLGWVRPGEKGIPFMLPAGMDLLVARNRSDGVAELWRYTFLWELLVSTDDPTNGMNSHNSAISLLTLVGDRLYIGFDNETDGLELWRLVEGIDLLGFNGQTDLEKVGESGLGPAGDTQLAANAQILDFTVGMAGELDLYLVAGCEPDRRDDGPCDRNPAQGQTDFGARVFRQTERIRFGRGDIQE